MFVHLHAHSYYSFMEGLTAPSELVERASKDGMPAIALCDHRYLTGVIPFVNAASEQTIKPIIGLEIDVDWQGQKGPLVLLTVNRSGWSNLCRISSFLLQTGSAADQAKPLPLDILKNYSSDLVALSGGQRSLLDFFVEHGQNQAAAEWLNTLAALFPQRLYVELQQHTPQQEVQARRLAQQARLVNIPVVATQDIYYLEQNQADLQHTLSAMRCNRKRTALPKTEAAPDAAYFPSAAEMRHRFAWIPEAVQNTLKISEICQTDLPLDHPNFPSIPLPPGQTAAQMLRFKAEQGAKQRYGKITPQIRKRLEHELTIIQQRGYEPIFLIVEELLAFARKQGVPISSRGSAASSLVAYCLKITNPDPLALNLYFERFLNPARATPPDIDTDLCSRRRETVIQHVFDQYGAEKVAMVGTINHFRPRSALSEVAKAFGLSQPDIRSLVNTLPYHFWHGSTPQEREDPFAGLQKAHPEHQNIFEQASALLRQPRHLSMHPGGIVVAPGEITDLVPVMSSGAKGITITQLDLGMVERFGLVKIDLLGIRGLSVLGDVCQMIYSWRRSELKTPLEVLDSIPLDDEKTAQQVRTAQTIGCFQIESPGMRATLKDIEADSPDDIMAALALYRPGPLRGGLKDAFVRRYKGLESVTHLHPILTSILAESQGVILYQEQVLRIAHELGGLSLADSDLLRRAMSHFDPGEQMKTLRSRFLDGFEAKGVPLEIGEQVWDMMAAFAGYGFPKAHAASYAQVAWHAAWCKTHFPAEFMTAVLANGGGYYSQRVYLSEARRMGLTVRPPHVNHSRSNFHITYPAGEPVLYMGLNQIYGLTRHTQKQLIRQRPFTSFADLMLRVNPRKSEIENLIKVGALTGLGTIPTLLSTLNSGVWRKNQPGLFDWGEQSETADWSLTTLADAQEAILGISLSLHPLERYKDQLNQYQICSTAQAAEKIGQSLIFTGMRITSRRTRTSQGDLMFFLSIEDLEGMLEVVFFPAVYRQYRQELRGAGPFLIRGTVELDAESGEPWLRAEKARKLKVNS
jgi:DNA-directed DNA polymerase III PolC